MDYFRSQPAFTPIEFFRIGHGRDAADTSFATIFGNAVMRDMNISTQLADEHAPAPQYSEQAISNYPSE